jgi:hypothetical protein
MNTVEFIILFFILAAGIVLSWLMYSKRDSVFSPNTKNGKRNIMILLISVGLFCRLIFAFCVPIYSAPDERAHMSYIQYITENKTIPVQPSVFDVNRLDYEYYQPPLYYLTMSTFVSVGRIFDLAESSSVFLVRSISVLQWLITIVAAGLIVRKLEFDSDFLDIFVVAFVSLLPSYMFISSMVNNDNLLTCLASVIFLVALQSNKNISIKSVILIGVFSGLAFITKYTGVMVFAFVAVFIIIQYQFQEKKLSLALQIILEVLVIGLIVLPFLLRNKELYGAFIPLSVGAQLPNWDPIYGTYRAFKNLLNTFWGVAGKTNNIKFIPAMIAGNLFVLVALFGIAKGVFKKESYVQKILKLNKNFSIATLISVIIGLLLVIYYGIHYGHAQGRFLFPLIIPIGIWISAGFKNAFGVRVENIKFITTTVSVFILSAVTFTAYTLFKIHVS